MKQKYEDIIKRIDNSYVPQRYCYLIFGIFLSAFSFNLFFEPYNIVTGGSTGLSIIFKRYFNIDPSLFVLIISILLIILSFIFLGKKITYKNILGTILLPIFMKATSILVGYFDFKNMSMFLIVIYGAVLSGIASGIILKTGYTSGGFYIIYQIMNKYLKISIGTASRIVNIIIIVIGSLTFGLTLTLYAVISLVISTFIMDRLLLGVSKSKAFFIITDEEQKVKEYIMNNLTHTVTVIDGEGGYSKKKKTILMCIIPTKEYFALKEVVHDIDDDAFFLITDSYEVFGGK